MQINFNFRKLNTDSDAEQEDINSSIISTDQLTFNELLQNKYKLMYEKRKEIIVGILYCLVIIHLLHFTYTFFQSIIYLDYDRLEKPLQTLNLIYILASFLGPIFLWLYSTNLEFWTIHNRKFALFNVIFIGTCIRISAMLYMIFYEIFIPGISKMQVTPNMTINMIVNLGYLSTALPTLIIFILFMLQLKHIHDRYRREEIEFFKLKHYVDFRVPNPYAYDLYVVTDMKSGKKITVKEHDRYIHTEIIGATGTAKTSSVIGPSINSDLLMRIKNEDAQKKEILEMLEKQEAYATRAFEDEDYNISYIKPFAGYEKKYEKIVKKYRMCGILAVAPDDSLTDSVYALCKAKGVKCKRVDPKRIEGKFKSDFYGFNPLYISPHIPEYDIHNAITKRATLVADVMQAIGEMSGKSEFYFSSINRSALTTIATLLMLTYPRKHSGKQPNLENVQMLLNDFNRINDYYEELLEMDQEDKYLATKDIIRTDFLGAGRIKFEDQCRGIRIQLDNFLHDSNINSIMCSDNTIDFDEALEKGEIILCNIELGDLGKINSAAFGLFFTLSYADAVLRRPGDEWTRLPNFAYIDELPILASASMESWFTLFRKFRSAMTVAVQTLEQMNKNDMLRSLRGVMVNSCGTHIMFGRANPEDMKLFSVLDGEMNVAVEQNSVSQTSLTTDNPSYSEGSRVTMTKELRTTEGSIRFKDFQEVTVITTDEGRPLHSKHGKVSFLPKHAKQDVKRFKVNWKKFYKSASSTTSESSIEKDISASTTASKACLFTKTESTVVIETDTESKSINKASSSEINPPAATIDERPTAIIAKETYKLSAGYDSITTIETPASSTPTAVDATPSTPTAAPDATISSLFGEESSTTESTVSPIISEVKKPIVPVAVEATTSSDGNVSALSEELVAIIIDESGDFSEPARSTADNNDNVDEESAKIEEINTNYVDYIGELDLNKYLHQ